MSMFPRWLIPCLREQGMLAGLWSSRLWSPLTTWWSMAMRWEASIWLLQYWPLALLKDLNAGSALYYLTYINSKTLNLKNVLRSSSPQLTTYCTQSPPASTYQHYHTHQAHNRSRDRQAGRCSGPLSLSLSERAVYSFSQGLRCAVKETSESEKADGSGKQNEIKRKKNEW